MAYVPQEIQEKILLSLPVKSLLRFKSVCRSWNKYISSKSFCYSHLAHNKNSSNTNKYLLCEHEDFYSAYLVNNKSCLDVETSDHIGCFTPKLVETSYVQSGSCYLNIYGICNGILCLSDGEVRLRSTVYLWNPIARSGMKIRIPYKNDCDAAPYALAFGYDDDDYKVIKMARFRDRYQVNIFSLRDSKWGFVKFTDRDYSPYGDDDYHDKYMENTKAVMVNNVAYILKKDPCQVICFGISSKTIRTVNFPEHYKADSVVTMKEFGGSIALLEYGRSEISTGVVMWVLCENRMWYKKLSVDLEGCDPLGFIDDGTLLVRGYYNEFMLFNLETVQFSQMKFRQHFETLKEWKTIWEVDYFTESLVLLDRGNMDEYFVKETSSSANTTAFTLQKWKIDIDEEEETE